MTIKTVIEPQDQINQNDQQLGQAPEGQLTCDKLVRLYNARLPPQSEIPMPRITLENGEQKTVFAKIPACQCNKVIKAFKIQPQDNGSTNFKVVKDAFGNEMIIADKPLDLIQFRTLRTARIIGGEYFVEDVVAVDPDVLYEYLRSREEWEIKYWDKDKIVIKHIDCGKNMLVRFTNLGGDKWKVEVYANSPFSDVHYLLYFMYRQLIYWPKRDFIFEGNDNNEMAQGIDMVLEELTKIKSSIENLAITKLNTRYAKYLFNMLAISITLKITSYRDRGIKIWFYGSESSVFIYIDVERKLLSEKGYSKIEIDTQNMSDLNRAIKILNKLKRKVLARTSS